MLKLFALVASLTLVFCFFFLGFFFWCFVVFVVVIVVAWFCYGKKENILCGMKVKHLLVTSHS